MEQESKPIPRRLADFEIIRRLGVGGMAEVFLAKKRGAEGTFKLLVVKRVLPAHGTSRRFRAMFAEEAQLATRLNHPNIVQVYEFQDYGEDGQLLTMEYVEGPDLRRLARAAQAQGRRLPPYVAAYIVSEVAKGLHYAHERKDERGSPLDIVHRDVSPQNVLLSLEGAVKIADFGIASANMFRDEPGVLKGKTAFMSPEQARGEKVDRRTDIYSLGVVFYELLTGRPVHGPLEGQELLLAVRAGRVEPPSTFAREVPQELEAIIMRALSRRPGERFASARDMGAAITRALFQKQQLVDSHVLETVIGQFVGREQTFDEDPREEAPREPGQQGSSLMLPRTATVLPAETGTADPAGGSPHSARLRERAGREVRHVAVVELKLHGVQELTEKIGVAAAEHAVGRLRATLNEIAFKRNALLTWGSDTSEGSQAAGRAVVGLLANPTRAPADAVWFAVDTHEAIHGACDDMPVRLAASIGIARGIASGKRDAAGNLVQHELEEPATYLADLLGRRAPPGVSWVAGGLYRLVRRDFLWGDAPTIRPEDAEQRGLPRHMRIYALLRPLTREERLQEMSLAPNDLIGRDAELADLHAAYYTVVGSAPGLGQMTARAVSGELGIGKTALATTFLNELPPDARILRVECSPARSEVPFAAVAEWIRELTGTKPDQSLEEAGARVREALGQFALDAEGPEIISRLAGLVTGRAAPARDEADHAHNRQLIATGLQRFFARAALEAPLVVVLDGLQWCDTPSLKLLTEFLRSGEALPVLVLLITRADDHIAPYIDGLVRIELRGLSAENQIRLLQTRLGVHHGVAQVCADLLPRAGGNPFFLLEMVDALLERGLLEIRASADGAQELARAEHADTTFPLPSTLEQLIADRLSELPAEEQIVIDWLAVAGGPLADRDLRALLERDSDESVARLCARGLCDHRGETIDVRHPLTRDVAYLALDKDRREAMHRQLGEHLAQTPLAKGLTAAIIARHLARGKLRSRAADFYLEAATAARGAYQTRLARRYYQRVAALLPDDDLRGLEAHEALEAIGRNQGRSRERRRHLVTLRRMAKLSKNPYWAAMALLRTARYNLDRGHLSKALLGAQRAEKVSTQAGIPTLVVQGQALMAEVLRDVGDMQGALAAVDRALGTTSLVGVPARLRAEVLRARGTLLRRVGRVDEAVNDYAEAIAVFRRVGARRMEARAKSSLAFAMYVLGRFEDGVALALDAIRIDLSIGGRFQIATTLSNIGQCYAGLGDLERGLAYLHRACEAHERYGDQDSRADTLLATAEVLIAAGDVAAAESLVRDAGALTAVTGSAYDAVHEKILRSVLAREARDPAAAVMSAFDARQAAEAQAYAAFHFYAMAIEAAARVEVGEQHTGILLSTTAMGAIETLQGSEYGILTRALCCEALLKAGSLQAGEMLRRGARYVRYVRERIRDPELLALFDRRRPVELIMSRVAALEGAGSDESGERLEDGDAAHRGPS